VSSLPTIGGVVTRGECYVKLLDHLREAQDLCATMAHLIQLQDSNNQVDVLLARGWLGIEEMLKMMAANVTKMAMGKMQ